MTVRSIEMLVDDIRMLLDAKKQTVSVAESVTSGFLQLALSQGEGASFFFMGGITAYNIAQKYFHLKVDISDAVASNCVSQEVSSQMASTCCNMFSSTWAIGITGYATEMPPLTDNGLYACIAIALNGKTVRTKKVMAKSTTARKIQEEFTIAALTELKSALKTKSRGRK